MGGPLEGQQLLRNPDIIPTNELIAEGLGETYATYAKFIKELEEHYAITLMEWRFYNDGKACREAITDFAAFVLVQFRAKLGTG